MADFKRAIRSSYFTFLVGKNQTPMTIHSTIAQDTSDILYAQIHNRYTKDATHRVASLDDVEIDTFIGFCEYAYTGTYVTPDFSSSQKSENELNLQHSPTNSANPHTDQKPVTNSFSELEHEPPSQPAPEETECQLPDDPLYNQWDELSSKDRKKREKSLIKKGLPIPGKDFVWPPQSISRLEALPDPVLEEPKPIPEQDIWGDWNNATWSGKKNMSANSCAAWVKPAISTPAIQTTGSSPYEHLWERFQSLEFLAKPASFSSDPDLLFHAKLYVFATIYRVEPLQQQCLKSIHRDLCNFSLKRDNIFRILDLLEFSYVQTKRDKITQNTSLRDLIIHYAACKAQTLADNEQFTRVLDSNGEMGSDFVMSLVK